MEKLVFLGILLVFPLEYLRLAMPASRTFLWLIALDAIGISLVLAHGLGGWRLARSVAFPLAFLLAAVPWPSLIESQVTVGLMGYVTNVVVEMLHFMGVEAIAKGTTITLRAGPLGVEEACSGIRSLQSGIMYSLAVGELFFLPGGRRVVLSVLTILSGFSLNLIRTFILSYSVEVKGMGELARIHDQVGTGISLALPVIVWLLGKVLSTPESRKRSAANPVANLGAWIKQKPVFFPHLRTALVAGVVAFLPGHLWLVYDNMIHEAQRAPFMAPRNPAEKQEAPKAILDALAPTSGGFVRKADPSFPLGISDGYYFFWEPRANNYNVLWHNPERCMGGSGWVLQEEGRPIELSVDGVKNSWMVFRFKNPQVEVLQIWGAWRNGSPIVGNRRLRGWSDLVSRLSLFNKGKSAIEIVSIVVPFSGATPPVEAAKNAVEKMFTDTRGVKNSASLSR